MGEKFNRFKESLKQTIKNLGSATDKVLNSPALKKIEQDINKASNSNL